MRRTAIRDLILVLAAILGFHALFVSVPARLAREEPSWRVLPLTAPDCATFLRSAGHPGSGWFRSGGAGPDVPAAPVRH